MERLLRNQFGREYTEHLLQASVGYTNPLPVAQTDLMVANGYAFPRIAGGAINSFSDLISKGTQVAGKQTLPVTQTGTANVLGRGSSLWGVGANPPAGAAPAAPAAGTVCDRTTVGALGQPDASGGSPTRTRHYLTTQMMLGTVAPHTVVLYDRLWHVRPGLTSGAQACTGVPTRYLTTESPGNLVFIETATVLPATAHTWSVTYTDESGNTGNVQSVVGVASAAVNTMDMTNLWYMPLLTVDTGVRAVTSIDIGTTLASGALNVVIGRPLVYIPIYTANQPTIYDGINSAFNLAEVKTGACLSHLVIPGSASATTFNGAHEFVASD